MLVDDDWSQIANAMANIGGSLKRGSVYANEFEQTFWKIMTGNARQNNYNVKRKAEKS